jgi:hypothetical protein
MSIGSIARCLATALCALNFVCGSLLFPVGPATANTAPEFLNHGAWKGFLKTIDGKPAFGAVAMEKGKPWMAIVWNPSVPFFMGSGQWDLAPGSRRAAILTIGSARYTATAVATDRNVIVLQNRYPDEGLQMSDKAPFKVELEGLGTWDFDADGLSMAMKDGFREFVLAH